MGNMRKVIPVITVEQITQKYGFHPNTVSSWLEKGLPHFRAGPGGKVYIPAAALEEFLNTHYRRAPQPPPSVARAKRIEKGFRVRSR